jgi:hypothetical protein
MTTALACEVNTVTTLNNVSELSLYSCSVLSKTLLLTVVVQVQNVPKDQVKSELDERHKECHLRKWYCLSELENNLVGQVLAKEYSWMSTGLYTKRYESKRE